jgi:hypothetical protein
VITVFKHRAFVRNLAELGYTFLLIVFVVLGSSAVDAKADSHAGMRPVVLLANDLLELKLNNEALELMVALSQDTKKNSFNTEGEAASTIKEILSALEGIEESGSLLDDYVKLFEPMVVTVKQKRLQQVHLDELVAAGDIDAADILAPLVDQPIASTSFEQVIENTLAEIMVSDKSTEPESEPEKTEAISAALLEKESDEAFKAVVKEIVATGDDPKSLLAKLIEFGKKINPIGKDFKALKEAKDERKLAAEAALATFNKTAVVKDDIQSDADVYENAMNILIRHIKDHQLNVISLNKKNKTEDAAQEQFIVDELLQIYVDELTRVEKNKKIEKINEQIVALNKVAEIKAKLRDDKIASEKIKALDNITSAEKKDVKRITELVNTRTSEQIQYVLRLDCDLIGELPSITNNVYDAVQRLLNIHYLTVASLQEAIVTATAQLTEAQILGVNPPGANSTVCVSDEKNNSQMMNELTVSELIAAKAVKPFEKSRLSPVTFEILPGCTSCSAPFKGASYGFFPYWAASDEYVDLGLPNNRIAILDYSAFTNIAYFALPIQEDGKIQDEMHLKNTTLLRSFFKTLTTYNVKRDIVLYSSDWINWGSREGINVNGFAEDHYQFILEKHKQFLDWGGISGVTFYFDHYTNEQNVDQLVKYIKHFKTQMQSSVNGRDAAVFEINLLLGIEGLETQDLQIGEKLDEYDNTYFAKLRDIILAEQELQEDGLTLTEITDVLDPQAESKELTGAARSIVDHVLVIMDEPTSPFKKRLRMQIESEFSGGERVEALLSVVPIMNRTNLIEDEEDAFIQFQDDIAYLKYNFGGMGLWNLPYTGFKNPDEVNEANAGNAELENTNITMSLYAHLLKKDYGDTEKNFIDYGKVGVVGQVLMMPAVIELFDVCGQVCPKRDGYLWLFLLTTFVNSVLWVLWRTHCKSRRIIRKFRVLWVLFQASTALLFLVLLGCLPDWQENNGVILGVTVGSISIVFGVTYLYGGYEKEV